MISWSGLVIYVSLPALLVACTKKDGKLTPALNRAMLEKDVIALKLTLQLI